MTQDDKEFDFQKALKGIQEVSATRRNGKSKKTIKSLNGNFELQTPRDRTFSPKLVKKHQTTLKLI